MGTGRGKRIFAFHAAEGHFQIAGRRFRLPRSRMARIGLGSALVLGGVFSFLPVLGLWMIPLGMLILSQDLSVVRRWRRRAAVRFFRWRRNEPDR